MAKPAFSDFAAGFVFDLAAGLAVNVTAALIVVDDRATKLLPAAAAAITLAVAVRIRWIG